MLTLALLSASAFAACPDIRDCQHRASTWEDTAWVGIGFGWGATSVTTYSAITRGDAPWVVGPAGLGSFALSAPLMAAAATPSKRAVSLSTNELSLELRRRPRWWTIYGVGLAIGAGAVALDVTDTGQWWLQGGLGITAAGLFTASAAGFAHDSRWIRRQAPTDKGPRRPRVQMQLVPTRNGWGFVGQF